MTPLTPLTPLVSVIIAARNESRRIGECLASLAAQTYAPIEIIVVDDGSTDATADIAERAGARVIRKAHGGKARAVAAAAEVATGEIFCFLDGDMVFDPGYVAALAAPINRGEVAGTAHATELVANPENRWSRCWQRRAGLPLGRRLALTPAQLAEDSLVFRAVRAADFRRVGGFDDIGYLDDQTLSPKLGTRARWVMDARCRHYNVESLSEVVALGHWGAHSILHLRGPQALRSYRLPRIAWRAARDAVRYRSASMAAYALAYEWGVRQGLTARLAQAAA